MVFSYYFDSIYFQNFNAEKAQKLISVKDEIEFWIWIYCAHESIGLQTMEKKKKREKKWLQV